MKGFFRWFRSGTKMKRWMLLILIGIVLASYGMAEILSGKTFLNFVDLIPIIAAFVAGFLFVIIGIVHMQKRTLELFVQETDERYKNNEESKVKSLIYNKKIFEQGPKIVAIGGGTGLNSVLKGLKQYTDNITAIVTVSDYGEATTDSRKILQTLPYEDVKQSIVALAKDELAMKELLEMKFKEKPLRSLSFGDVYLLAMKDLYGDSQAVAKTKDVLGMTGKVLPVTLEPITICAELEDGTVIERKDQIPEVVNSRTSKINRIFVSPTNCRPAPGVIEAIEEADAIVIGPGSLYTNVIPNLLIKGVAKAIKESKAFKIYVSNIMTEPGQTDNYTLSDHLKAITDHAGKGIVEYCIYDTGELIPEFIRKYNMQGQDLVEVDASKAKEEGVCLMQRHISHISGDFIRHNPDAIAASIIQLICDDLKFKDMQNDTKYVLLNDKLHDAKQSLKHANQKTKKTEKKEPMGESKFFKKYKTRIESIQESEIKLRMKAGIPFDDLEEKITKNKEKELRELEQKRAKHTKRRNSLRK